MQIYVRLCLGLLLVLSGGCRRSAPPTVSTSAQPPPPTLPPLTALEDPRGYRQLPLSPHRKEITRHPDGPPVTDLSLPPQEHLDSLLRSALTGDPNKSVEYTEWVDFSQLRQEQKTFLAQERMQYLRSARLDPNSQFLALSQLSRLRVPGVREFLFQNASNRELSVGLRSHSLSSLGYYLGPRVGDPKRLPPTQEEIALFRAQLSSTEPQIRRTTPFVVGYIGIRELRGEMSRRLKMEPLPEIRAELREAIPVLDWH